MMDVYSDAFSFDARLQSEEISKEAAKRYYTDANFKSAVEHGVMHALRDPSLRFMSVPYRINETREAMRIAASIAILLHERDANGINGTPARGNQATQ